MRGGAGRIGWAASGTGRCTTVPARDGHHAEVWGVAAEWGWLVLDRSGRTVACGVERTEESAVATAEKHLRVAAYRFDLGLNAES